MNVGRETYIRQNFKLTPIVSQIEYLRSRSSCVLSKLLLSSANRDGICRTFSSSEKALREMTREKVWRRLWVKFREIPHHPSARCHCAQSNYSACEQLKASHR
jgi:hypothetical protein